MIDDMVKELFQQGQHRVVAGVHIVVLIVSLTSCGRETAEAKRRAHWQGRESKAIDACLEGVGPDVDRTVALEACTCVFEEIAKRWTPDEYRGDNVKAFNAELQRLGVVDRCGARLQGSRVDKSR